MDTASSLSLVLFFLFFLAFLVFLVFFVFFVFFVLFVVFVVFLLLVFSSAETERAQLFRFSVSASASGGDPPFLSYSALRCSSGAAHLRKMRSRNVRSRKVRIPRNPIKFRLAFSRPLPRSAFLPYAKCPCTPPEHLSYKEAAIGRMPLMRGLREESARSRERCPPPGNSISILLVLWFTHRTLTEDWGRGPLVHQGFGSPPP